MRPLHSIVAAFRGIFPRKETPVEARLSVVALVAPGGDRDLLTQLAAEHRWTLQFAQTYGDAVQMLSDSDIPIILCDRDMDADWRDVIRTMAAAPHPVYTILVSSVADDYLWTELVRWGGHDLLTTPLRETEVLRAMRLAWSYWNSSMKNPLRDKALSYRVQY